MTLQTLPLNSLPFDTIIEVLQGQVREVKYNYKKHQIELLQEGQEVFGTMRLPLHLSLDENLNITSEWATALYLSIESGSAAICIMEGEENLYHTTFGAYMTRKKQGYSQIKYLNKKGKSRAGSRVRLAESITFFENINHTLQELFDYYEFDRIALGCSISLLPHLYGAKVACPFEKNDERLYKIPLHLPQSNFTNLEKAIKTLAIPQLNFHERYRSQIESLKF